MDTESYPERVRARILKVTKPLFIKFLTIVAVPFWPLFFLLITPFLLYSFIISKLARCFDSSLGSRISGVSSIMSAHTPYSRPFNIIVLSLYMDSPIEKSNLVSIINEKIFNKGMYPELKQRIVTRFGFQFWKKLDSPGFKLNNHIRYYLDESGNSGQDESGREVNQLELLALMGRLSKLPFDPSRSPWEVVLVKNYKDHTKPKVKSVIIIRAHHCFIDAHSIINVLTKLAATPPKMSVKLPEIPKLGLGTKLILYLRYIVSYPNTFINYTLSGDVNPWVEPSAKSASQRVTVHESATLNIATLKEIKRNLGVSMTCLLNTIFIGGVQGLMKSKHQIWREFRLHMPIMLLEDSSDKLENHFIGVSLNIQLSDNSIYDTLRNVDMELRRVVRSTQVSGFRNVTKLIGCLPVSLHPHPSRFPGATVLLSNIPGPVGKVELTDLGYMEDFGAVVTPVDNVGIISMAISHNGTTKFTIAADSAVLTYPEDKEAFSNGVADALNQLHALGAKVIHFGD